MLKVPCSLMLVCDAAALVAHAGSTQLVCTPSETVPAASGELLGDSKLHFGIFFWGGEGWGLWELRKALRS